MRRLALSCARALFSLGCSAHERPRSARFSASPGSRRYKVEQIQIKVDAPIRFCRYNRATSSESAPCGIYAVKSCRHEQARISAHKRLLADVSQWRIHSRISHRAARRDRGLRLVDAVILPDEPHRRATYWEYPSLAGRHVIVVQTKASRMGMYLMGHALFSARLVSLLGAASVRSILLCLAPD